jgi:phospholipid-binding lipoprotein MlaA
MSASIITAAMLLATTPVNTGDTTPAVALSSSSQQIADSNEGLQPIPVPRTAPVPTVHADQSADFPIQPVPVEISGETAAAPPESPLVEAEASPPEESTATEQAAADGNPDTGESVIVVTGQLGAPPGDPLASVNATTFDITQSVDKAIVGPVAMAYESKIPEPVRDGISNFLDNLREPLVFLNFLLQLKPGKAAETFGRFAVNSTIGVGGLFDVARKKPINLPRRSNGFSDTMGYYGVKPGAFLFLPILGPTTIRDVIGGGLDSLLLPTAVGSPFNKLEYNIPTGALNSLGERADFDDQLQKIREESDDPYTAAREYYLAHRQAEIDVLRGKRASVDSPLYETPDAAAQSGGTTPKAVELDSGNEPPVFDELSGVEVSPEQKATAITDIPPSTEPLEQPQ